jgi:hypothetical protein
LVIPAKAGIHRTYPDFLRSYVQAGRGIPVMLRKKKKNPERATKKRPRFSFYEEKR